MEESWLEVAKACFDKGFAKPAYTSSTALVAIIKDDKIYIANAGDSKAVLIRNMGDNQVGQINLSETHSVNKKREQDRLVREFPGERDIFQCLKTQTVGVQCYVKGGLQPTRSFGDFRLKHRDYNFHNFTEELGYRLPIPIYSGPYITYQPDIKVHKITSEDKYLILATDGLWNNFPRKQTSKFVQNLDIFV